MRTTMATAVALLAGSASQAAFISFASDTSPANPTFVSTFDGVTYVGDFGPTNVDLLVDADEHGPLGPVTINANMTAEFVLTHAATIGLGPTTVQLFGVSGHFEFRDAAGAMILRADIGNAPAAFQGVGTFSQMISASISGANTQYTLGTIANVVGFGGVQNGDFGFTLTAVNGGAGASYIFPQPPADGSTPPLGIAPFTSEGSFSGSFIPAPGPAFLLGLGGLVIARRRR